MRARLLLEARRKRRLPVASSAPAAKVTDYAAGASLIGVRILETVPGIMTCRVGVSAFVIIDMRMVRHGPIERIDRKPEKSEFPVELVIWTTAPA